MEFLNQVLLGDCLVRLKELPDCTYDSCVTDVPYGLADREPTLEDILAYLQGADSLGPLKQGRKNCLNSVVELPVVPETNHSDSQVPENLISFHIVVASGPVVPSGTIQLDDQLSVGEEKIGYKGPVVKLDDMLVNETHSEKPQSFNHGQFSLGKSQCFSGCIETCRCFTQSSPTTFSVLVWLDHDPLTETESSTKIMTGGGAKIPAMLTLDVGNMTGEIRPANITGEADFGLFLLPPKNVGALPGAGSLFSLVQVLLGSEVGDQTDRTDSFDISIPAVVLGRFHSPRVAQKDFMNKGWEIPSVSVWKEVYRILKPGAYVLCFGGTRTFDLISMGLRAAGFENRDTIAHEFGVPVLQWVQGMGMPKSSNPGKVVKKKIGSWVGSREPTDEHTVVNAYCTCLKETRMDSGIGGSVGDNLRYAASSSDGAAQNVEFRESRTPSSTHARYNSSQNEATCSDSVPDLREKGPQEDERDPQEQEKLLFTPVCIDGAEDSGFRESALRARVESSEGSGVTAGQSLSMLQTDPKKDSSRASLETVPIRGDQQFGELGSSVRFVSSQDRGGNDQNFEFDTGRCHSRRILLDDTGRWGHARARVCSWCGSLDKSFYDSLENLGSALKPAWEPILVFRKPVEKTLVENVLKYGTGGINIDATRVKHASKDDFEKHKAQVEAVKAKGGVRGDSWKNSSDLSGANDVQEGGRWPANILLTHSEGCQHSGTTKVKAHPAWNDNRPPSAFTGPETSPVHHAEEDGTETVEVWNCVEGCPVLALETQTGLLKSGPLNQGGASRFFQQFEGQELPEAPFFYTAKPSKNETTLGGRIENEHPTKKPIALMKWLIRLVTRKGGLTIDPYCGSGSTLHAAIEEGVNFTGIERDEPSYKTSVERVTLVAKLYEEAHVQRDLFDLAMSND